MKKRNIQNLFILICTAIVLVCIFTGCGSGDKAKIESVNESANTFDIVNQKTKAVIEYDTLIINGNKVIDTYCTNVVVPAVVFAFNEGEIVREGGSVTTFGGQGYTVNAVFTYTLEDGILTLTETE